MADPFIGEIRTFSFDFAPRSWAICQGQIMSINQNQALYSLLGTTYGGDGVNNFALPDLQGRAGRHRNDGESFGQKMGAERVVITQDTMPAHTHELRFNNQQASSNEPGNNVLGLAEVYADVPGVLVNMAVGSLSPSPGQAHNNMQPSLVLNFCMALQGIYPPRN